MKQYQSDMVWHRQWCQRRRRSPMQGVKWSGAGTEPLRGDKRYGLSGCKIKFDDRLAGWGTGCFTLERLD